MILPGERFRMARPPIPKREGAGLRTIAAIALFLLGIVVVARSSWAAPPVLTSACEPDYPPFSRVDDAGRPDGFSVELFRAAVEAMGRRATFRTGPWAEVKAMLARGEIQALPLVGRTPEREALFDFTFPYLSLHGAIVVREGTEGIQNPADLRGRSVAVMRGDNAEEFLRRADRGIDIRATETFAQALRELSAGRHDAVVIQRLLALRLIRQAGLSNLHIVERPLTEFRQDFCFAVAEGDAETLSLLNEGLALVMANGAFRHLHAKWFGAPELTSRKGIIVGGDRNYPPYEFLDDQGRPDGFLVALTRGLARELGLEVEIRLGPWAEIRRALEAGEIDAIQGMLYTPGRDLLLDFSPPHTVIRQVGVVRRGEGPPPETAADLRGRALVVMRGDIMHDFAVQHGLAETSRAVDGLEEALAELIAGRSEVALVPRLTALYFIRENGWKGLIVGRTPLLSPEGGYAVNHNRTALLAELSEGLKTLEETGEFRRIREQWLDLYPEIVPGRSRLLKVIAWTAAALVLVILILFLRLQAGRKAERRQARTELARSEARFEAIFDAMPLYLAIWRRNGGDFVLADVNPATLAFSQGKVRERLGAPLREFYGDTPWIVAAIERADRTGKVVETENLYQLRTTGCKRQLGFRFVPIPPDTVMAVAEDITERKAAEAALAASLKDLRLAQRIARVGNWSFDPEVGRPEWSDEVYRIYRRDPSLGPPEVAEYQQLLHGEHWKIFSRAFGAAVSDGTPYNIELKANLPDGEIVWVNALCEPDPEPGPAGYRLRGTIQDITDRKRLEAERRELERRVETARRHESLVTMAGAIAHNFNNILMTVLGNLDMALEDSSPSDPARELITEAHRAAHRAAQLSRLMRLYVGQGQGVHTVFCLRALIGAHWSRVRRRVPEKIGMDFRPEAPEGEYPVRGDEGHLFEALLRLVENAVEAIGDRPGKIAVRMARRALSAEDLAESYLVDRPRPGEFVRLSVSDTGAGMSEETRQRLFEPYYTTKFTGRGLGLAAVLGIVRGHGGAIQVASAPGEGATVDLLFPIAPSTAKPRQTEPAPATDP